MKRFIAVVFVTLFLGLSFASASLAQYAPATEKQLFAANYLTDFGQIFVGKVFKGENIFKSFGTSAIQAVPAALLHHQGAKLAGRNWKNTFTAQLIAQKGNQVIRRSILGKSLFSKEMLTQNEFEYLAFNIRLRGLKPEVRLNFAPVTAAIFAVGMRDWTSDQAYRFNWKHSLKTGVIVWDAKFSPSDGLLGATTGGNIMVSKYDFDMTARHEMGHYMQEIRGNAMFDVAYQQDFSQNRDFANWLRIDYGHVFQLLPMMLQGVMHGGVDHDAQWIEWEAEGYTRLK